MRHGYGSRIRDVRQALKYTQKEFAKALHVRQPTVSDWEQEQVIPAHGVSLLVASLCADSEKVAYWLETGEERPALHPRIGQFGEGDRYTALLARFHALLQELPLLVFELDAEDRIVSYSAGRSEDLRLPESRFMGKRIPEVLPTVQARLFAQAIAKVRQRAETIGDVNYALPMQDRSREYLASIVLLPDEHVMVLVRRARNMRRHELGLGGQRSKQRSDKKR